MQRLRNIHQTGLAFHVYMSAHHTRFEHSLGVCTIASRIFDQIYSRQCKEINNIIGSIFPDKNIQKIILRLKQELRLAALLHDAGHSIFSHTSERVYSKIGFIQTAAEELSDLAGKEKGKKGAGEVISFCLALTDSISNLVKSASENLLGPPTPEEYSENINWWNVALIIIGRAEHPYLQFLGDIVSSGFDADKLDYLLRDAASAGLPLQYDFDRYLFSVCVQKEITLDGENNLKNLYDLSGYKGLQKHPHGPIRYQYLETYRLRLPKKAMNTIEQIIICKLMLFSYIYHHRKVRASEGILQIMLERISQYWQNNSISEENILEYFLDITDSSLDGFILEEAKKAGAEDYRYRIINRLLPREVYSLSGASVTHAEGELLKDYLTDFQDRSLKQNKINELEQAIGEELLKLRPDLNDTPKNALFKAGIWVDVPSPPEFEDVEELVVGRGESDPGIPLLSIFPIDYWTDAYKAFRYQVRIFAFSDYLDAATEAAKKAMQRIIKISGDSFYEDIKRRRA